MTLIDPEQITQAYERLSELMADPAEKKNKLMLLRQLVEGIYKKLSADSNLSFSGLFARMQYCHERYEAPAEISAQLNQLRVICNRATHEDDFLPSRPTWLSALHATKALLLWLAPEVSDEGLDGFLEQNSAEPFRIGGNVPKSSFTCGVQSWELIRQAAQVGGLKIVATLEDGSDCTIFLNNMEGEGRQWSRLEKTLWKFCTLNCHNLSHIQGRQQWYQSNPSTLIVVEPDFLIDASAVAECFTQNGSRPDQYLLGRMVNEPASESMVLGILVNSILDELVYSPKADFQDLFRACMARRPISFVALGLDAALSIYNTIHDSHFPAISAFANSVQGDAVHLEPSYICPKYGLQGRLDILYERGGKRHIVELKSGKPHPDSVWPQQLMQVVAYDMIIREGGGATSKGYSSILYSAAQDKALRHVLSATRLEQELLMCRNRIVGIMRKLAQDPGFFFEWLRQAEPEQLPQFILNRINSVLAMLDSLEEHEYQWFLGQLRLLVREIWFEKTGGLGPESIYGHNSLWQESVQTKQDHYRILNSLIAEDINFNQIRFKLAGESLVTDFRAGDIVVLYRQNLGVDQQEILRGQISSIGGNYLEVTIRGGLSHIDASFGDALWALEHDIMERSLYNPLASIFAFLQASPGKRSVFLGLSQPRFDPLPELAADPLEQVMQKMFAARDYHIVQGPPGTGKTSGLLTSYIHKLFKDTDKNVLILSFTNRAVDEICQNLRKQGIDFIRTGQSDEVEQELMDNRIQGKKFQEVDAILKACRVWVATVQSCNAWLSDLLKVVRIDELVIDEASQIMENSILGIIARIGKVILIGDQNQLPPITRQSSEGFSFADEKLAGLCYDSYGQSLMERLDRVCKAKSWLEATTMLNQHYRMHDEIADLVQRNYDGLLVSAVPRQKAPLPVSGREILDSRLVWIEFPPSRFAWYDPLQVECVKRIIKLLTDGGTVRDLQTELGIVAPFRAMIHALRKELPPACKDVTIDTVERFQGSERSTVIITLPLHNQDVLRNVEALSATGRVDRKLNVAVSRAQERLFVLGCPEICQRSAHYKFLMDKIGVSGRVFQYSDTF